MTAIAAGLVALAARPVAGWAILVTLGVGVTGGIIPSSSEVRARGMQMSALVLGVAPFLVARSLVDSVPATPWALVPGLIAGIAEEAFFRRAVYGWFLRLGVPIGIIAGALLFAAVHIPAYGTIPLALNFAAGIIFGWQRWASGTWRVPAATHAVANLLQLL